MLIDSGGLIWQTNASALGAYNLEITHKGLTLYRGQQPVMQTESTMTGWTRIQWLAVDGVVRVAVNQLPILTYVDPTPLPGGTVQLFTLSGSALVDNISLAGVIQSPTAQLESEMLLVASASNSQIEFSVQSMSTGNAAWIGFIYQTFISVEYDIQIIKPDGTLRTTLWTGNMFTTFVNDAQVSPDGSKVILTTNSSGSYRTYLLNTAAPYNYRRGDTINDLQTRVQWANDGQGYYYTNGSNIYYMPLAGGVPPTTVFTKPASCDVIHDFVLSRDYSHSTQTGSLIFESDCQPNSIIEIYMWQVAATGGTPIDVTASPPVWALSIRGSEWLSPDQTQIVNGRYSGLSGTSDIVRLLASNRNFLATVIPSTADVSFTQLSWGGSDAILPTPIPSLTPMPSPTPTPTWTTVPTLTPTPTVSPSPTATLTPTSIPRSVALQVVALHSNSARFGLPLPLSLWPMQETVGILQDYQNGFGPNNIAYRDCYPDGPPEAADDLCQYRFTRRIHPGIDYYTIPLEAPVVAICDGVIIDGRPGTGGGSALPNAADGLSLRCFADDSKDADGDGLRNLSNIVVIYNHLTLNYGISKNSNQIVRRGDLIATTSSYITRAGQFVSAHLDLQIFLGAGFRTNAGLQMNPLAMYDSALESRHANMAYPVGYDRWSLQGNLLGSANFWQNPSNSNFIYDLNAYLNILYPSVNAYIGPQCGNLPAAETNYGPGTPYTTCTLVNDDAD